MRTAPTSFLDGLRHDGGMGMPCDSHVHSEWSWDTGGPESGAAGTMERTCARAIELGLPAVVFTDHLDAGGWLAGASDLARHGALVRDGRVVPPRFDLEGYLDSIGRCRRRFAELRILTGVELGQPHLVTGQVSEYVDLTALDRVIGSLHTLPVGADRAEPVVLYEHWAAETVVWRYLEEMVRMVAGDEPFEVVTHLDYAVRTWPVRERGPFDVAIFEDGFRGAMRAIAASGRALEMSAALLQPWMPRWWAEEGGRAVSFASDAHEPGALGVRFAEATAMVAAAGFRPGRGAEELWRR